jgi:hypothetical protein
VPTGATVFPEVLARLVSFACSPLKKRHWYSLPRYLFARTVQNRAAEKYLTISYSYVNSSQGFHSIYVIGYHLEVK